MLHYFEASQYNFQLSIFNFQFELVFPEVLFEIYYRLFYAF